jgi:hypothetical protein
VYDVLSAESSIAEGCRLDSIAMVVGGD